MYHYLTVILFIVGLSHLNSIACRLMWFVSSTRRWLCWGQAQIPFVLCFNDSEKFLVEKNTLIVENSWRIQCKFQISHSVSQSSVGMLWTAYGIPVGFESASHCMKMWILHMRRSYKSHQLTSLGFEQCSTTLGLMAFTLK